MTSLWDGVQPAEPRRRSPRSQRVCRICKAEPDLDDVMYRLTRSEASFDPGRIVWWLCEACFTQVDQAFDAFVKIAK